MSSSRFFEYMFWLLMVTLVMGAILGLVAIYMSGNETEGEFINKTAKSCPKGLISLQWVIADEPDGDPVRKLTKVECKE